MISLFIVTAKKLIANIALSLISEKFLEWAFFNLAERLVKSTSTPHDDEWFFRIKEAYLGSKDKE